MRGLAPPIPKPQHVYDETHAPARVWRMLARHLCGGTEVAQRTCAHLRSDSRHSPIITKHVLVLESGAWLRDPCAAGPRSPSALVRICPIPKPHHAYDETNDPSQFRRMLARQPCGGTEVAERTCAQLRSDSSRSPIIMTHMLVLESDAWLRDP